VKKVKNLISSITGFFSRLTGFSILNFGAQWAPRVDTSFRRAQDERALMDEIWNLAVSEAYCAKDAHRRMQELVGLSREGVIETYLTQQPELKRFVDRSVEAGACTAALRQLQERRQEMTLERAEQRNCNGGKGDAGR
jgi:hypothetical protein